MGSLYQACRWNLDIYPRPWTGLNRTEDPRDRNWPGLVSPSIYTGLDGLADHDGWLGPAQIPQSRPGQAKTETVQSSQRALGLALHRTLPVNLVNDIGVETPRRSEYPNELLWPAKTKWSGRTSVRLTRTRTLMRGPHLRYLLNVNLRRQWDGARESFGYCPGTTVKQDQKTGETGTMIAK